MMILYLTCKSEWLSALFRPVFILYLLSEKQDETQRLLERRFSMKRELLPGAHRISLMFGRPGVAEFANYRPHTSPGLEFLPRPPCEASGLLFFIKKKK
jgi:hypothetical protein